MKIDCKRMSFDKAIRLFKRKAAASGIVQEYRERQQYVKPSQRRKEKLNYAKRRQAKRNTEQKLQITLQSKSLSPEERQFFMKQHRKIK